MSTPSIRTFANYFPADSRQKVITLMTKGNTLKTACRHQRLNYATLLQFFNLVKQVIESEDFHIDDYSDEEKEIISFYLDTQSASALAETVNVQIVHDATKDDWKAAQWLLKTRNSDEWSEQPKAAHTSTALALIATSPADNQSLLANPNLDLRRLTSSELQLLEELITKASTPPPAAIELPQVRHPLQLPSDAHPASQHFPTSKP